MGCYLRRREHLDGRLFTEHAPRLYTTEELDQLLEEQAEKERK